MYSGEMEKKTKRKKEKIEVVILKQSYFSCEKRKEKNERQKMNVAGNAKSDFQKFKLQLANKKN